MRYQGAISNEFAETYIQRILISWAKEKTNRHYVREVEKLSLSNHFKNASRVFEYIWYGNITLDRDAYEKYLTFFDLLNSQL
ncbi:MAG: DUF4129 domain-containing protein [Saprospiraceae bacterium]|nr:DUF4129 domain-containing protein [Saprospiraceae bacterium]